MSLLEEAVHVHVIDVWEPVKLCASVHDCVCARCPAVCTGLHTNICWTVC